MNVVLLWENDFYVLYVNKINLWYFIYIKNNDYVYNELKNGMSEFI